MDAEAVGSPKSESSGWLDVLLALCQSASSEGINVFFLGSQTAVLQRCENAWQ